MTAGRDAGERPSASPGFVCEACGRANRNRPRCGACEAPRPDRGVSGSADERVMLWRYTPRGDWHQISEAARTVAAERTGYEVAEFVPEALLVAERERVESAAIDVAFERDQANAYITDLRAERDVALSQLHLARKALPDPSKLRLLADWFDVDAIRKGRGVEDGADGVQFDLRRWADAAESILASLDGGKR